MDRIGPLDRHHVTGRFVDSVEHALEDRRTLYATARALVEAEFPPSVAGDVLTAVGFDPDEIYGSPADLAIGGTGTPPARRRSAHWPAQILASWDPPVRLLRVRRTVGVRPTFMGDFALKRTHAEDDST